MSDKKPLELDLSVLSRRGSILAQIHAVHATEGHTDHFDALAKLHDAAAQEEHGATVAHTLSQLSPWERLTSEDSVVVLGEEEYELVEEPEVSQTASGAMLITDILPLEPTEFDMSDFDDMPTQVFVRAT